jgi:hypothetical protein
MIRAVSRPNSFRRKVAALWRNWCGCQCCGGFQGPPGPFDAGRPGGDPVGDRENRPEVPGYFFSRLSLVLMHPVSIFIYRPDRWLFPK